jgi:hypothetical protein
MALFEQVDIENILRGSGKAGLASSRFINNAVRKSFRNRQMLRSTQQFDVEDLVDQLKRIANDALRLEKALALLKSSDPNNKDIRNMNNLLDSLNNEKQALSRRINEALASRSAADDVVRDISNNRTPLKRGRTVNPSSNRATLGSASLNVLGAAINVAGYINKRRGGNTVNTNGSNLTSSGGNTDANLRQNLKISRDTFNRDKEFQEEFSKDYNKGNDNIVRRLDKIIDKLDRLKVSGSGGSGGSGSDFPDIDLPDNDKEKKRGRRGSRRSRFGLKAGAAVGGAMSALNNADVLGPDGKPLDLSLNPVKDTFNFLTDPKVESAFQSMRDTARSFLGLSTSKPNTSISTPSTAPIVSSPTAPVIPPAQNFGGMPGLPRLNTQRVLSTGVAAGGTEVIPGIRTNETDIEVRPQATVIINTKELEIKGVAGSVAGNTLAGTVNSDSSILGGIGGGIGGGGVYPGGGAGVGAIMGSRGGGRGQAFTPSGMQRQSVTTNAFGNQPVMALPSDIAGPGTAGGGVANPYGFSGMGTGSLSTGNMGSAAQLPGNVTSQGITSSGSYPKFLGPTSGGALGGLISSGEGGYGSYNRGVAGDTRGAKIDFSQMSVSDLMQRQSLPAGDPNRIFAFGKYQVIPSTMKAAVQAMGIDPSTKITPQLQEEIYRNYLISQKRPEVKDYITSQNEDASKLHNAQQGLAKEFASVADPDTGASRYGGVGGNKASIGADKTAQALQEERRRYQENLKTMKPEEAWSALSNPQGMDSSQSGATAGGAPTIPEARTGETPGQLAARIKSLNPNIGNGECVALAKQAVGLDATPGANSVSDWRKGESATARELPIGTPVATFMDRQGNDSDKYDAGQGTGISRSKNGGLGTTHAAVVAGYEKDANGKVTGMQVWEQWNGSGGPRLKTYPVDPTKPGADNAGNFYAVNDSKGNPLGGANNPLSREAAPTATANSGPVYDPTKTFGDPSKFSGAATDTPSTTNTPTPEVKPNTPTATSAAFQASSEGFKNQALGNKGFSGINPTGAGAFTLPDGTVINSNIDVSKSSETPSNTFPSSMPRDNRPFAEILAEKDAAIAKQFQKEPLPGESFTDYMKRQVQNGKTLGNSETDTPNSSFGFESKRQQLLNEYNNSNKIGSVDNEYAKRIENEGFPQDDKTIRDRRNNRYNVDDNTGRVWEGDEYTPNAGNMSLEEIRRLNSSDGITPNASTDSSSAGSTRQSAAPPIADTPTPAAAGSTGNNAATNTPSKQDNPTTDTKAVGEGSAPSISDIPVKNDDLGLAVINSYDL